MSIPAGHAWTTASGERQLLSFVSPDIWYFTLIFWLISLVFQWTTINGMSLAALKTQIGLGSLVFLIAPIRFSLELQLRVIPTLTQW